MTDNSGENDSEFVELSYPSHIGKLPTTIYSITFIQTNNMGMRKTHHYIIPRESEFNKWVEKITNDRDELYKGVDIKVARTECKWQVGRFESE